MLRKKYLDIYRIGRFYIRGRIIRLDELGQTFVVRLLMRLQNKDGHKTYASRRTIYRCASPLISNKINILKLKSFSIKLGQIKVIQSRRSGDRR